MNKLLTGHEQAPAVVIMKQAKLLFWAVCVVGWFPTVVRIRLSQPQAGDWLAGAWAELDNILTENSAKMIALIL